MSLPLQEQYDKVYKYCWFKMKNAHLAEDLTQETFLRFFAGNKYISRGKPLAYLYTIAKNLCIDQFRKKVAEPLTGELEDTDAGLEAVELSAVLQDALKILPEDVQEILLLQYANDLSIGEIATFTGLSRFAVRRKINGALSKLKSAMREEDFA
ncbi:MAG: RNA polymerase sigma factor [Defluviitaleaceae bacterium]|nr:RNA polymerase sigma factor [Defluviitaleaceae bacterium]MCL2240508.1 RNA polymerase sigma factor [Defluviitaleaceae bacterium]